MKNYFYLFILTICMTCKSTKTLTNTPPAGGDGGFDKQGHRGCRGLMPENTVPAMLMHWAWE